MFTMPEAIVVASIVLASGMVLSAWIISRRPPPRSPTAAPTRPAPPAFDPRHPRPPEACPVEPSGIPVEPETRLGIGTAVLANWGGTWWRARVIGLERDGRVRIHYVGWGPSWDSTVSRGDLQMDISSSVDD